MTNRSEPTTVNMVLPRDVVERFKRKAKELLPEEGEEAASVLLSIFIEFMSSPEHWCLFIPDLPAELKPMWQVHADKTYDQLYEVSKTMGTAIFGPLRDLLEGCLQRRRMDADDFVKLMLMSIKTGTVTWQKADLKPNSNAR